MNSNDPLYLTSMMESIEGIESYTQEGAEAFFSDGSNSGWRYS